MNSIQFNEKLLLHKNILFSYLYDSPQCFLPNFLSVCWFHFIISLVHFNYWLFLYHFDLLIINSFSFAIYLFDFIDPNDHWSLMSLIMIYMDFVFIFYFRIFRPQKKFFFFVLCFCICVSLIHSCHLVYFYFFSSIILISHLLCCCIWMLLYWNLYFSISISICSLFIFNYCDVHPFTDRQDRPLWCTNH